MLTNPAGHTRTERRNVAGQLVEVQDANDKPGLGFTRFAYEPFGNLSKTVDPNGNAITVVYDLLGRKVELNDPDLGKVKHQLNPLGQLWR